MRFFKYAIFAILILPAIYLMAFGPRADDAVPKDRVVVEYWEKWTAEEQEQMGEIVKSFNDTVGKDKGIYVDYMSTAAINQKVLVASAAGVPPDIAGVWDNNLVQFASQNALEPLEDMARAHGITASVYKPVYWNACNYKGHLWGLVSTPGSVAMLYNRVAFEQNAGALRAAGLDPTRPPRTIDELDRYSDALVQRDSSGRITRTGFFPMEPNWWTQFLPYWFGAKLFDEKTGKFTLTDPKVIQTYTWFQNYAKRMGAQHFADFQSGLGTVDSPQNAFLVGTVLMEQQGPWMANYFEHQKPAFQRLLWSREEAMSKPLEERRKNFTWAAAAFPSAVPGLDDVTYACFDAMVIPRQARHPKEAFEFIAYVNQQEVMERLCTFHCKNSPLAKVSDHFLQHHPNPYIDVFDRLAASPNAHGIPQIPIWPEVVDEITAMSQRLILLETDPKTALQYAQDRLQSSYDDYLEKQRERYAKAEPGMLVQ
jgi:multiple sugar transport system substrate-binding protein